MVSLTVMEMLDAVKTLLDIKTDVHDDKLEIMIRDAEQTVLAYCHIDRIPKPLETVVRQLVMTNYRQLCGDNVESVKRGDTQITYMGAISADVLTDKHKTLMNSFRKVLTL